MEPPSYGKIIRSPFVINTKINFKYKLFVYLKLIIYKEK